jgi:hypothetical protein
LKKWIVAIWFLCIAFQLISKIGFITWFEVNQEELTESCCVNRNKPKLNCNAKCFLVKNLKELDQESSQKSTQNKLKYQNEEVWFFEEKVPTFSHLVFSKIPPSKRASHYSHTFNIQVFQPPRA